MGIEAKEKVGICSLADDSNNTDMWKEYAAASDAQDLDEETLRLLSVYFGGGGYFLLRYWLLEDIPKTPQEIFKLIVNVLELSNKK